MNSLVSGYRALVLGDTGALGQAFVSALKSDPYCAMVTGFSRSSMPSLLLEDPQSLQACAHSVANEDPFHLVIDATGALIIDDTGPEKRLDDLDAHHLQRAMQVNAIGPAMLLKYFSPVLATSERVIWAKLSARVGSIEDNRKGGWYGYRASKAALNMFLQTAAIEIVRRRPQAVIAALQPGTVRSRLSRPFVGDEGMSAEIAAQKLLRVLDELQPTGRAQFVDHTGQSIPW
jgi:NAD(P)-dependent dehydrogenase (short-subunit alcohol dehydrogenase family)